MDLHEDKIAKFLDACERAAIKDPVAFLVSKRPQVYDWLKGAFPFGILPTDIDGLVHLEGHFLLMEFKHASRLRNGGVPKGQARCVTALTVTGFFTVFLIGCDDCGDPSCMQEIHAGKWKPLIDCDREFVRGRCSAWSEWVQKGFA